MTGNPRELFRKFFGAVRAIIWLCGSFFGSRNKLPFMILIRDKELKHGNGNVQPNVRANNSGPFEGTAHEMWGFEANRVRKFTRTSARTLPWNFITLLSAPPILNPPEEAAEKWAFVLERCIFLPKHTLSYRKMHFPAKFFCMHARRLPRTDTAISSVCQCISKAIACTYIANSALAICTMSVPMLVESLCTLCKLHISSQSY